MRRRISGFAFEPSWLADQVVILYLPWLMAALLTGYRALRRRWLEVGLLLGALVLLLLTYSRGGIINAVFAVMVVALVTGGRSLLRLGRWFVRPFGARAWAGIAGRVLLILVLIGVLFAISLWLGEYQYFANLWTYDFSKGIVDYIISNSAGPRLVNSVASFGVFTQAPWSGVGLGASGFYLFDAYPDWAMIEMPEISRLLSPDSNLFPNPKNLYLRLLAETGLPGFWLFITFLLSILGAVRGLLRQTTPFGRFAGTAGLFLWLTIAFRNGTQDSLTFPIMWVSFGMVVGLAALSAAKEQLTKPGTESD